MSNENKNDKISQPIKPYKKDCTYSYTLGAFPTIELIKCRPNDIVKVLIHSTFTDREHLEEICRQNKVKFEYSDKLIARLSDKENCFVVGIFDKYTCEIEENNSHLVLVNPSNMGNLGTIIRTAVGFGIYDLAIITPCADVFNPKTVRSSMGSLFRLRVQFFTSFEEYELKFKKHKIFSFILNKDKTLALNECPKSDLYSLVFGNEATGLPVEFLEKGTSVMIPQSPDVDSLNLTIAVGVGLFHFAS